MAGRVGWNVDRPTSLTLHFPELASTGLRAGLCVGQFNCVCATYDGGQLQRKTFDVRCLGLGCSCTSVTQLRGSRKCSAEDAPGEPDSHSQDSRLEGCWPWPPGCVAPDASLKHKSCRDFGLRPLPGPGFEFYRFLAKRGLIVSIEGRFSKVWQSGLKWKDQLNRAEMPRCLGEVDLRASWRPQGSVSFQVQTVVVTGAD